MTAMKNPFMKKSSSRLATTPQDSKPKKRDNTFSKSRDTREDRGARQMKTSHSSQTFTHGK
jgi:hypothetical protein